MKIETRADGFYINGNFFFPIGFNYWPRDTAVRQWAKYNPEAIEREFVVMEQMGVNCIRMFMLWEDLSPSPEAIDESFFAKFDDFLARAKNHHVYLNPTLLIGHMSRQDWFPTWFRLNEKQAKEPENRAQFIPLPPKKKQKGWIRDIYTDKTALSNALLQIRAFLGRYKEDPGIVAWDLSNENQYWMQPKTPAIGREYMRLMYEEMKKVDPNHPITYGMGKFPDRTGFNCYGPESFLDYVDYDSEHVYPGPMYYPPTVRFFDFYVCWKIGFSMALAKLGGKPVQLQEFGLSDYHFKGKIRTKWQMLEGYYNVAVWSAIINGIRHGILSWCFADFAKPQEKLEPYNHALYETRFGNVDVNYNIKASGKVIKKVADFMQKIEFAQYRPINTEDQVAIAMPENYNAYPNPKSENGQFDDNFFTQIDTLLGRDPILMDSNTNHNKALFSAYLWCKSNQIQPKFIDLAHEDITGYKIVILPNLHHLAGDIQQKLAHFLSTGGTVYVSSNTFHCESLLKVESVHIKPKRARKTIAFLTHSKTSIELPLMEIPTDHTFKIDETEQAEKFCKDFKSDKMLGWKKGNYFYLATSPEINHTKVRNMYKWEHMHELYRILFDVANVTAFVNCNNPRIEAGLFQHMQNPAQWLLIIINHEFKVEKAEVALNIEKFTAVEVFKRNNFAIQGNTLKIKLQPYEERIFILN